MGTEEHKQSLIDEMSSANVSLFIDEHLSEITEPSRIFYKFEKFSTLEDNFVGNVVLNIVKIDEEKKKYITFRYLKGRNKVRFPPQIGAKGNPVFMLFFERDARDMQRLTGGNALFFRSRIRHAIAATETKDISLNFKGENISAQEITFKPFTKTKLKNRVNRYKTKEFRVTMSNKIPGYIYKIETFTKDTQKANDIVRETLTFQGIKTNKELREIYKERIVVISHEKNNVFNFNFFGIWRYDNISTKVNDFPTYARSEFVFACMSSNANNRDFMAKCSCAVDEIAKEFPSKNMLKLKRLRDSGKVLVQGKLLKVLDYQKKKWINYSEHKQLLSLNVFSSY